MRVIHILASGTAAAWLFLGGAGCLAPAAAPTTLSASPQDQALALNLHPGDRLDLRQTFFGLGGWMSGLAPTAAADRQATLTDFVPNEHAGLAWQSTTQQQTSSSRAAQEQFLADLKGQATSGGLAPPPVEFESVTTTGEISGINLADGHILFLPSYWPAGASDLQGGRSGLWLSHAAFDELTQTSSTEIDLDMFDHAAGGIVKNLSGLNQALSELHQPASTSSSAPTDLTRAAADAQPASWTLKLNGEDTTVAAIKARNWFGEFILLDNPQDPLILKLTVNPLSAGAADLINGGHDRDKLFGYEIDSIETSGTSQAAF